MKPTIAASGSEEPNRLLDTTQCKVEVLDPNDGTLKRPWLLAVMDQETRVVLHHEVLLTQPSATDAVRAVEETCKGSDNVTGIEKIQTDNASIFSGEKFKQAVDKTGIQHTHTKPPRENGRVERFFREIETEFLKEWHDRAGKPPSLSAFQAKLKKFIEDRNSRQPGGSTPTAN